MTERIFPEPFKMTTDGFKALESTETTPVGRVRGVLLLGASLLLDLAFLPPSAAESIVKGEKLPGLPGGFGG
jgi:hypothetical protein